MGIRYREKVVCHIPYFFIPFIAKKKQNIKSYQGLRHLLKLSVNGQNTQTNAKTQK